MTIRWQGWGDYAREAGLVVLGLILAVIPLALWLAWSEPVYWGVLTVCLAASALFLVLSWLGRGETEEERLRALAKPPQQLSPEFIAELHRITPLTYHHRRLGDPRLRGKFLKLLALLQRGDDRP